MKKITFLLFFCLSGVAIVAQSAHQFLRDGNSAYEQKEYSEAAEKYYKALEKEPNSIKGKFNLGNAVYQKDGYEEAIKHYSSATQIAPDDQTKADAFYNLGNAFFQQSKTNDSKKEESLNKSIEAYKNALRLEHTDANSKKNLAIAQRNLRLIQQQKQPQQNQQQQEKKEEQNEEQPQQNQQGQEQQQQQENKESQQPKDLSKEEAMQLLQIMDDEEKKVQEKLRKAKATNKKVEKDW